MKEIILNARDGYQLVLHVFECDKPKAVIQVMHGMEEYQNRYEEFASFLTNYDYIVITSDMRGHGPKAEHLGYFDKRGGYKKLIEDQIDITSFIKTNYPGLPINIFAHSMGTITCRLLLHKNSKEYKKVVLSGYPNYQSAALLGAIIADNIQLYKGADHKSKLIKNLAFKSFINAIEDHKTDFDWLSYNEDNVNKYIDDKLCGYGFGVAAYRDLFLMTSKLRSSSSYKNVNENMPILLISGADDPVTGGHKGRKHTRNVLKKAGFLIDDEITYFHARHEILNEKIKATVMNDCLNFYNK